MSCTIYTYVNCVSFYTQSVFLLLENVPGICLCFTHFDLTARRIIEIGSYYVTRSAVIPIGHYGTCDFDGVLVFGLLFSLFLLFSYFFFLFFSGGGEQQVTSK